MCGPTEAVRLQSRAWLCRMNAVLVSWRLLGTSAAWRVTSATHHSRCSSSTAALVTRRCNGRAQVATQQKTAPARQNAAQTRPDARFSVVLRRAVQGRWSYRCANTDTAQPLLPSSVISTARAEAFAAPSGLPFIHTLDCLSCPIRHQSRREEQPVHRSSFHPHSLRRSVPLPI
jgi:hypothetical protein